ncbi:hypothetical protein FACS1894205_4240 [Alphaproteobacteria bacterium]|nr:hypothetical protein FACS1894205_4240 [Alphaproteobacteria bacterium]
MHFIQTSSHFPFEQSPVWKEAAIRTEQADPFCCTAAWQLSFHDAFSPKRRLFVKESSNGVLAFAEKIFTPEQIYLTPIEPLWFFGCPLLGEGSVSMLSEAMGAIEKTYAPQFPRIMISGIRPNSVLSRRLARAFSDRFDLFLHSMEVQCAASLAGGIDGFLSRRSANHRKKIKKESRKAQENGIYFERVVPSSPQESEAIYSRMLSVERASWKGTGRCGMAETPSRQFYGIMLQRLSVLKEARIVFAKQENEDIGFIFGGMAGNIYRGQQFSYDEKWEKFSVGNLMQQEQITWLCEEGAERYDMGPLTGSRMGYKIHWTEEKLPIETWVLERR